MRMTWARCHYPLDSPNWGTRPSPLTGAQQHEVGVRSISVLAGSLASFTHALQTPKSLAILLALLGPFNKPAARELAAFAAMVKLPLIHATHQDPTVRRPVISPLAVASCAMKPGFICFGIYVVPEPLRHVLSELGITGAPTDVASRAVKPATRNHVITLEIICHRKPC